MFPQHLHTILYAAGTVRDQSEIIFASRLLVRTEAAVVGRRRLQVTGLQTAPQRLLVFFAAKWRAHDMRGSSVEVFVEVHRIVDQQMSGEYLTKDSLAFVARTCDRLK